MGFNNETVRDEQALLDSMEKFGGGFASALAIAWQRADSDNRNRLRLAFGDLLESYRKFLGNSA